MQISLFDIHEDKEILSPLIRYIKDQYLQLKSWAEESKTDCFRLYDRDLPQYPLAIDFYAGRFCIQYFTPARGVSEPSPELVEEIAQGLYQLFKADSQKIYWRTRAKSKETRQYEKREESKEFFVVHEYGVKFKVNLRDYLDTGLFLDHRETRQMAASLAEGKRMLNLFAYTCSFSVQAAAKGALFTKSVDLSNTYVDWGKDNFKLNGFSLRQHEVVRDDCLKFLDKEIHSGRKYDVIIIDPPTISRSKKMSRMFDVQVDYVFLISKALKLLTRKGTIFFSTNSRKFVFETDRFPSCSITEISDQTIPPDFHDRSIHRCWTIMNSEI